MLMTEWKAVLIQENLALGTGDWEKPKSSVIQTFINKRIEIRVSRKSCH